MSQPPLEAKEFRDFFEAVYKKRPFPWQSRLAERVFERGWPGALDVPTGAGKTAAIDVALFHLALEADRRSERSAAMRIVFVVDRRLVVDDAYERAERLRLALDKASRPGAPGSVVRRVAERLMSLSGPGGRPLATVRLRGGAPKDPDWARTPCQPLIVVSTVDQVGSRLLFRGYGVSDSMKPVHAGLLGADALHLLDEAHLSQPFVQTVKDTMALGEPGWRELRAPLSVVTLSATQTDTDAVVDLVQDDDREPEALGPRLTRPKTIGIELVKGSPDSEAFREALVSHAWRCSELGEGTAKVVAVVVNRVRRARLVFEAIQKRIAELGAHRSSVGAALLIGRTRPLDREEVLRKYRECMRAGGEEAARQDPLFVVATQCIEAGADLDFDALVTEIAPLDCLRQRFGRLNRMGRLAEARGVVVAASEQVSSRANDPIYSDCDGDRLFKTWSLLDEKAVRVGKEKTPVLDFGVDAARAWLPPRAELERYVAPRRDAPVLLPAFLEQWSCTSPVPEIDPEVALFLHGPDTGSGDVQIVWRADVEAVDPRSKAWIERLAVCPPSSLEAVSVPIAEARRWLAGDARADVPDLEVAEKEVAEKDGAPTARALKRALRWRGAESEETRVVGARDLRPGDLVVVPSTYGGCDAWGWEPQSREPVRDIGGEANRLHRGRDVLRLSSALVEAELAAEVADAAERRRRGDRLRRRIEELRDAPDREIAHEIEALPGMPASFAQWFERERGERGRPRVIRNANGSPIAVERRVTQKDERGGEDVAATEDDEGSGGERRVPLKLHSADVRSYAERFARGAGLSDDLVQAVALAGFLHDAGKARIEFKQWLYGGDELAALVGEDLAKSGQRRLPRGARGRAGLPDGARHEVASLGFALAHPKLGGAGEHRDLVLWLVGTHHGHGRPFFPPVEWPPYGSDFKTDLGDGERASLPAPSLAELTAWWLDLHERLERKYGPWGLARLEAILRLADHRASAAEQPEDA
jgi:CRISPR-associated endonuclease/helicase Cas3